MSRVLVRFGDRLDGRSLQLCAVRKVTMTRALTRTLTRTRTHSLRVLRRVRLHVERFVLDRWQRQSGLDPPCIGQLWQQVEVLVRLIEFLR